MADPNHAPLLSDVRTTSILSRNGRKVQIGLRTKKEVTVEDSALLAFDAVFNFWYFILFYLIKSLKISPKPAERS